MPKKLSSIFGSTSIVSVKKSYDIFKNNITATRKSTDIFQQTKEASRPILVCEDDNFTSKKSANKIFPNSNLNSSNTPSAVFKTTEIDAKITSTEIFVTGSENPDVEFSDIFNKEPDYPEQEFSDIFKSSCNLGSTNKCIPSIGGANGILFQLSGLLLNDCIMAKEI